MLNVFDVSNVVSLLNVSLKCFRCLRAPSHPHSVPSLRQVYSPIVFGKQYDKNGDYIRKYVPELEKMPAKYIFEPWTAPISVQKQAGCVIGVDYPKPIVDHGTIHKTNMARMKKAYELNKAMNTTAGVKRKA